MIPQQRAVLLRLSSRAQRCDQSAGVALGKDAGMRDASSGLTLAVAQSIRLLQDANREFNENTENTVL